MTRKNFKTITKAMGMRGEIKPGDMTMKARQILGSPKTKRGLAKRGLI